MLPQSEVNVFTAMFENNEATFVIAQPSAECCHQWKSHRCGWVNATIPLEYIDVLHIQVTKAIPLNEELLNGCRPSTFGIAELPAV
jgi:hypothetical protein